MHQLGSAAKGASSRSSHLYYFAGLIVSKSSEETQQVSIITIYRHFLPTPRRGSTSSGNIHSYVTVHTPMLPYTLVCYRIHSYVTVYTRMLPYTIKCYRLHSYVTVSLQRSGSFWSMWVHTTIMTLTYETQKRHIGPGWCITLCTVM